MSTEEVPDRPFLIGGEWLESESGQWFEVVNPAQGDSVIARVPRGNAADADRAVRAAKAAFPAWRDLHYSERARHLFAFADAIDLATEDLATMLARETGNAIRTQSRGEARSASALVRYFAGVAGEAKGVVTPVGPGQLNYTQHEPLGVVVGIIPWNSPLTIAIVKIASSTSMGNTVIIKTAEDAPLAVLRLAEIANSIFPAGVLNVVTGYGSEIGEALAQHDGVAKVSFTGSTAVGRHLASIVGGRLASFSAELGGKSPNIVFPDAVNDSTIDGILTAMRFTRQGQSCTAGSRLLVHESVYDDVVNRVVDRVGKLVIGDPLDESSDMGSLINKKQFDRVVGYLEDGYSQPGVEVALRGGPITPNGLNGHYLAPTVLAGVNNEWRIAQEEIFGPVLVAIPWKTRDEVIRLANDSHYGLAAFIWTKNLDDALVTASRLETGWIQVNQGGPQGLGQSYGGYKSSGLGRENSLEGALEAFTQIKQINVKLG